MRNISDNRYLDGNRIGGNPFSVNSFLFCSNVPPTTVSCMTLYNNVTNMLLTLGFNLHLSGFTYLAGLVTLYLVRSDCDKNLAVAEIANHYGVDVKLVNNNIIEAVRLNEKFISSASVLLNMQVTADDIADISGAIRVMGAIFKCYYNLVVPNESDCKSAHKNVPVFCEHK